MVYSILKRKGVKRMFIRKVEARKIIALLAIMALLVSSSIALAQEGSSRAANNCKI
jgi:predicted membrane GTPase involved in stress response